MDVEGVVFDVAAPDFLGVFGPGVLAGDAAGFRCLEFPCANFFAFSRSFAAGKSGRGKAKKYISLDKY